MDLYADNILEHFRHPRGKGDLGTASIVHHESNPSCGDEMTVSIQIEEEKIKTIKWDGVGCAISQAAMSMLIEELEDLRIDDVFALSKQDIFDLLGVPISLRRTKCALLCLHTVKNALHKVCNEEVQGWLKTVAV